MAISTKTELLKKLRLLGKFDNDKDRNKVVCSLIGHSNIQSYCFGYVSCGRCDTQVGDSLAGCYVNPDNVVVGHNCEVCRSNYMKLTWRDKLYAQRPFPEKL